MQNELKKKKREQILREKEKKREQMLREKEKKKERKKDQIVKAAIELYSKRGFDRTIVEDIALKANIATGTFYTYFKEKNDVFLYFWEKMVTESMKEFNKKQGKEKHLFDQLGLFTDPLWKNINRDKEFAKYVFINTRLPNLGAMNKSEVTLMENLLVIIEQAKKKQLINKQVETQRIAEIIFAIHTIYLMYWLNGNIKTSKECIRRIKDAIKITFDGFSAKHSPQHKKSQTSTK
jgi:AcrR family transcriptional regulator